MSRGKRGTCNYKMYTFRISKENLKFLEWAAAMRENTKGQQINEFIESIRNYRPDYQKTEEVDPRQTIIDYDK